MSEPVAKPVKCLHQNFLTNATAAAISHNNVITGYRLVITARCNDCGLPFHFPNYVSNEKERVMDCASTCSKSTMLITPIKPGEFAPELN